MKSTSSVNAPGRVLWVVFFCALAVWSLTLLFGFVWDDHPTIVQNPSLHSWDTLSRGLISDFWGLHESPEISGYWRPVPTMLYLGIAKIAGIYPWAFHALNVALHVGVSIISALLLSRLGMAGVGLLVAGLFFSIHPIHSETVSFISALPDLASAFFGLASVLCGIYSDRRRTQALGVILLGLALLSKESAVVFPVLWIVLIWWRAEGERKQRISHGALALTLLAAYLVGHFLITQGVGIRSLWGGSLSRHLGTVVSLLPYSFYLTWIPFPLTPTRAFPISLGVADPAVWGALFTLFTAGFLLFWTKSRLTRIGGLLFFFFWLPVSNLFPAEGLIADRYLYLPALGSAILFGVLAEQIWKRLPRLWAQALTVLWLVTWGGWAVASAQAWRSDSTLWKHATKVSPGAAVAWNEYGRIQLESGDFQRAEVSFREALKLRPEHVEARLNRALVLFRQGNVEEALAECNRTTEINPRSAAAWDLKATILLERGAHAEAIAAASQAADLAPHTWKYRYNLADAWMRTGNYAQAISALEQAYRLAPSHSEILMNLAAAKVYASDLAGARGIYLELLRRRPDDLRARENLEKVDARLRADIEVGK